MNKESKFILSFFGMIAGLVFLGMVTYYQMLYREVVKETRPFNLSYTWNWSDTLAVCNKESNTIYLNLRNNLTRARQEQKLLLIHEVGHCKI